METKNIIDSGEEVIIESKSSLKKCTGAKLKGFLILFIMWLAMDVFFCYLIFQQQIAGKYWFVSIPIIGFNILAILSIYISVAKEYTRVADFKYILTNKAVYFCDDSAHKQIKRLAIENITRFEKDKASSSTFYACTDKDFIKFEYLENSQEFYSQLARTVNSK